MEIVHFHMNVFSVYHPRCEWEEEKEQSRAETNNPIRFYLHYFYLFYIKDFI